MVTGTLLAAAGPFLLQSCASTELRQEVQEASRTVSWEHPSGTGMMQQAGAGAPCQQQISGEAASSAYSSLEVFAVLGFKRLRSPRN